MRLYIRNILFILCFVSWFQFSNACNAQQLDVYHIDVEQGDATLFVSPSKKTLLIDSGRNGDGDRIHTILTELEIDTIQVYVNTHYHADHYGGIDELVWDFNIHVESIYDRGDKEFLSDEKLNQTNYKNYQESVGTRAIHLTRGETIPFDEEITVTCIASGGVVLGEENPVPAHHENDMSIALLIQYGSFKYFIAGDIELTTEEKIAHRDLVSNVDVYQANHHGSHTSSSFLFLEDLSPTIVVISNGNHGGFMHPRTSTLRRLEEIVPLPSIFQTNKYLKGDKGGNVEDEFIADLESSDTDGTIHLVVDNDSNNINVSYRDVNNSFSVKSQSSNINSLRIESILPNPVGSDRDLEQITLSNESNNVIELSGWTIKDLSGRIWTLSLSGSIEPQSTITVIRNGMPMSLNNDVDKIFLINPNNQVIDQFEYSSASEGATIQRN